MRRVKRAQILLGADAGQSDEGIARSVGAGTATVYRTKRRFVERGLEQALAEEPRPGAPRKLTDREELLLVATACSDPPTGRSRWTLELLAGEMVRLTEHNELGEETERRVARVRIRRSLVKGAGEHQLGEGSPSAPAPWRARSVRSSTSASSPTACSGSTPMRSTCSTCAPLLALAAGMSSSAPPSFTTAPSPRCPCLDHPPFQQCARAGLP